jgi:hypothetical protein
MPRKYLRVKLRGLPADAGRIVHLWRYAYCVAKPAAHCAVFVAPPQINRLTGKPYDGSNSVHNATAGQCVVGGWYTLAYCSRDGCHQVYVVAYQPEG